MTEELTSPVVHQEAQQPGQDELLLHRQRLLQDEAQSVLKELNLIELLSAGGVVRQTGSTVLGLMVWRDIDLQVSSSGLSIERAFEIMHPLLTHPRVKQVRYLHQSDHFKLADLDERYFLWCTMSTLDRLNGSLTSPSGLPRAFAQNRFMRLLSNN